MARQMKDSGVEWIGRIPDNWSARMLFQIFSEVKNKNEGLIETNLLSLSYGKIKRKDIDSSFGLLPESFEGYNIIEKDDIVLRLTDLQNDQRSLRTGLAGEKGIVTSAYTTLRRRTTEAAPSFMHYCLHAFDVCKGFYGMGAGVRQGLNWSGIRKLVIPWCSEPEQRRLSVILDLKCAEIDKVVEQTRATIEEYKKLKQAIITEAVTKGVRGPRPMKPSGVEWIGDIPEEWNVCSIKHGVSKVGSGKTPSGGAEVYLNEGVLFLRSQNIYDTGLLLDNATYISDSTDEEMSATRVFAGDVLLNITGGSIGRCCVYPADLPSANVNQHVCIIRTVNAIFTADYMHYFWISFAGKTSIQLYQTGGNREGMSGDAIKNTLIPRMDISEQQEIATYLDTKCAEIDRIIENKEQLIEELGSYKKSLIYEYVTGKKEVTT